jgi:cytoskeletal protein CcmA (bactofilin family)
VLKSHAHVVGDIYHQRLSIEPGAHFEGRSVCSLQTSVQKTPEKLTTRVRRAVKLRATREPVDAAALQ